MPRKQNKFIGRILALLLIFSTLIINSCEPDYCASCYDVSGIIRNKAIVICADNLDDLYWLMDDSEALGYVCEEDW
jgi:hypothetical protein